MESHAKCENSGWSILLHPDFGDTLGSFGRIMGNQALLDRQVRDWSCADPENMDNINIILDTYSHYIPLIMKPRDSSRSACWDQISVRWSKSLRAKASCAMQVLWLPFALWGGGSGAMSGTVSDSETLDKWQVFFGYLAIMPWDLCVFDMGEVLQLVFLECFSGFSDIQCDSWQLSCMTSRLWQAAWDLTKPSPGRIRPAGIDVLEVDKVYLIEYP